MEIFETIGIDGQRHQFQYKIEDKTIEDPLNVTFLVYSIPEDPNRFFQYTFRWVNQNTLKGECMDNQGNMEFSKKGIPEKIIQIASEKFSCDVISSPFAAEAGNFLVKNSIAAWERVVKLNPNAIKDEQLGYFILKRE